jgi:hypothetical protein
MIKYNILISFSKIFAVLITIFAFILAIMLSETAVFITVSTLATGIVVNKQINDRIKNNKTDNEKNN